MLLNVDNNAKIVVESELRANVPFFGAHECIFTLLDITSQKWCVISRTEQQKV